MHKLNKFILLLSITFTFSVHASDDLDKEILPEKIYALRELVTQADIEKTLGTPDNKEADSLYYIFHDFKYALSIKIKNGKLASFEYIFGPSNYSLKTFTNKTKFKKLGPYPTKGHEAGRYILGELEKKNVSYLFKNNSNKDLYSIRWQRVKK